jgi:hypothetical protein
MTNFGLLVCWWVGLLVGWFVGGLVGNTFYINNKYSPTGLIANN